MATGPFNITIDGVLMLPEQPLTQTGSHQQMAVDWENNFIYATQIINTGVLLPGEIAPAKTQAQRAASGDLAITKMERNGAVVGLMYVRGMGHGVSLNAEAVGSDTYLWMEADAALDGTFAYGQKIGRLKFVDGATVDSASVDVEKFDPVPGNRRVLCAIDFPNDRILISRADMTPQRVRTYTVYSLTDFRLGIYTELFPTFPRIGLEAVFQNIVLYGLYAYQMEGGSYSGSNPPPGNCYVSVLDITTGALVERVFNDTAVGLSHREPESLNVDYGVPGAPRLFFGFSTNAPAPIRYATLYYWEEYQPVPPPGPDIPKWIYTTNTVEESPFAWNPLMQRYRMARGISTVEVSPGVYEETRFSSYTDELDTLAAGLHYFRGGYEHRVGDAAKANLINSGVATESNFVLI